MTPRYCFLKSRYLGKDKSKRSDLSRRAYACGFREKTVWNACTPSHVAWGLSTMMRAPCLIASLCFDFVHSEV